MTEMRVTLELPDDVASEAEAAGLLNSKELVQLIQAELARRQRVDKYFETIDALHKVEPLMTQEEIDAELAEWKAERRGGHR